jgi:predicted esterase
MSRFHYRLICRTLTLVCFLYYTVYQSALYAQTIDREQVADTIRCRNEAGQSYALFVPAQYNIKKSWPVILIFDPAARGRTGVNTFVATARKYGFILACSNNSRNGPMNASVAAAEAMLQDVTERFTIDPKRIYSAGFSGGSRVAMGYALVQMRISGVIGCGAGLPNDNNLMQSMRSDLVYYGLAGTRDMNYPEMLELPGFFESRTKVISYLRTFSGGHQWPDKEFIMEAVEWLILQAMNKKTIATDQAFLSIIENKTQALVNSQVASGNLIDAARYMKFAARDFKGTTYGGQMAKKLSEYERSDDYQKALRRWNKLASSEEDQKEKYMNKLVELINLGLFPDSALTWWQREVKYQVRLRDNGNSDESQMAYRILNFISILCSERGSAYYRNGNYSTSAFLFNICTLSDSENLNNYYNLAKSLAQSGRARESAEALSGAIAHGFTSRKMVDSDPAFNAVKNNRRFAEVMGKLK